MIWDPKTMTTAIGRKPTSEELKRLPEMKYPFKDLISPEVQSMDNPNVVSAQGSDVQHNAVIETSNKVWSGFKITMKPGSLAVSTTPNQYWHVVTSHIGISGYWTEVGVYRDNNFMSVFSYDNDEGGYNFHTGVSIGPEVYHNYEIKLNPNKDGTNQYYYTIYCDGQFLRGAHLPYKQNNVDSANEFRTTDSSVTADTSHAIQKQWYVYQYDSNNNLQTTPFNRNMPWNVYWSPYFGCAVKSQINYEANNMVIWETWVA